MQNCKNNGPSLYQWTGQDLPDLADTRWPSILRLVMRNGPLLPQAASNESLLLTQRQDQRLAPVDVRACRPLKDRGRKSSVGVQLLSVERPDSSPASRRKLPSDAPGRPGSAAAAGAPSRRAWPTAAAAEVGAGSGALPRGAAWAGCARVCGPPLQTGGRERFYDRPMGADRCALAPAGLD